MAKVGVCKLNVVNFINTTDSDFSKEAILIGW